MTDQEEKSGISRRDFMKVVASAVVAGAAGSILGPQVAEAGSKLIKETKKAYEDFTKLPKYSIRIDELPISQQDLKRRLEATHFWETDYIASQLNVDPSLIQPQLVEFKAEISNIRPPDDLGASLTLADGSRYEARLVERDYGPTTPKKQLIFEWISKEGKLLEDGDTLFLPWNPQEGLYAFLQGVKALSEQKNFTCYYGLAEVKGRSFLFTPKVAQKGPLVNIDSTVYAASLVDINGKARAFVGSEAFENRFHPKNLSAEKIVPIIFFTEGLKAK